MEPGDFSLNINKFFKKRKRPSKKWLGLYFFMAIIAFFIVSTYWVLFNDTSNEEKVDVREAPKTDAPTGGSSTPSYDKKLKEYNRQEFDKAKSSGQSHIPTVGSQDKERGKDILINDEKNSTEKNKPEEKPKKKTHESLNIGSKKRAKSNINSEKRRKRMEELQKIYVEEMKSIWQGAYNQPTKQQVLVYSKGSAENHGKLQQKKDGNTKRKKLLRKEKNQDRPSPLKTGEVLYAVNDIEVNSDVPGKVRATILSGEHKDGVFLGSFSRHKKDLILEFSKFITEDGASYDVDAVGIDPDVPKSAIQSRVNNRTFQRWGGLIAASFISGLSDAVENSGLKTVVTGEGTVTSSTPEYTAKQQAMIATGNVADKLEQKASKYFDRPPTVYLDSGEPLGILVVNAK